MTKSHQIIKKADNSFWVGGLLSLSEKLKQQQTVMSDFALVLHAKVYVKYPLISGKFTCSCRQFDCILRQVFSA